MTRHALWSILAVLTIVAGPFLAAANGQDNSAASYSITSLGTLGGQSSVAYAINSLGEVVGSADAKDGRSHAFLYKNGKMLDLGTLGGNKSIATAINDAGQIAGNSDTAADSQHAFLYDNGKMLDLGTLGGKNSHAHGMNNSGLVVGDSDVVLQDPLAVDSGPVGPHAFAFSGGKMRDLAGIISVASAVNESGQIVGSAMFNPDRNNHIYLVRRAALFGKDAIEDFGLPINNVSSAVAINSAGQVVGSANLNSFQTRVSRHFHAFLYDRGSIHELGTLGGEESRACAINRSGQVVGTADTALDGLHAFLFDGDRMLDLNLLANDSVRTLAGFRTLTEAFGINDRGQIVGAGKNPHGDAIAFVLTPIAAKP